MTPAADEIRINRVHAQMPFADVRVAKAELWIRRERLGDGEIARRKIRVVRVVNRRAESGAKTVAPREQARARRRAGRITVAVAEAHALRGERINVWRRGETRANGVGVEQRKRVHTDVIGDDEQDVFRHRLREGQSGQRENQRQQDSDTL